MKDNQANREAALRHWALEAAGQVVDTANVAEAGNNDADWRMVAGDASFRRYFRLAFPPDKSAQRATSYIVMDAPPPQESVEKFATVAELMRDASLRVPRIFAIQADSGFMLLEDFGDKMLRAELAEDRGQALFDTVLPSLTAMVGCKTEGLPLFDAAAMQAELDLFTHWYLRKHCSLEPNSTQQENWQRLCEQLIRAALAQPQHFVHRDFHSCNLHRVDDGEPGIIDFQDAVLGPASYDLASWLWDRYISWPRASLEYWIEQARPALAPSQDAKQWQKSCDWMALQRNLKIIGIFARLNYRDGKSDYLELLPRFAGYVLDVLPRYSEFEYLQQDLVNWLKPCARL
ncbi:MAG: phosphotransferase [Gammaproteobacteria bacterium]|nr:phosphotransferase [Gammaproteobacteria bacterium]NND38233.1 phosphotransferase [Pseudomonadales bacterium]MBT8152065.1 phosphotransferase [Gammaproteobacteria bacterium]NNL11995.1 phosphotransferase [Pseudomonadales bacterium]NNM12035.1 phosphotransferase [Pseudomonadales bacterium]